MPTIEALSAFEGWRRHRLLSPLVGQPGLRLARRSCRVHQCGALLREVVEDFDRDCEVAAAQRDALGSSGICALPDLGNIEHGYASQLVVDLKRKDPAGFDNTVVRRTWIRR